MKTNSHNGHSLTAKREKQTEYLDQRIARCQSRIIRTVNVLDKLVKAKRRLQKAIAAELQEKADEAARAVKRLTVKTETQVESKPTIANVPMPHVGKIETDDPLAVPTFLRRVSNAADQKAIAEIKAEQAASKTVKAKASAAKSKAKAKGDLRKMPLEGRAALEAIKRGSVD
jgi:hypothetical protein